MTRDDIKLSAVFLILTLLLSACGGQRASTPPDDWENEVLLASECGLEGMGCCTDEPQCQYEMFCCADPGGSGRSHCAQSCECGTAGGYCCAEGAACGSGLGCSADGTCQICGEKDQPCCAVRTCNGELVCAKDNICEPCGLPGAPCCATGQGCENEDKSGSARTECRDETCVFCGSDGRVACQSEPACASGHLLNGGDCLRCGGRNEPCCGGDSGAVVCTEGLNCKLGFCTDL